MGTIQIRLRNEGLGNIGSVVAPSHIGGNAEAVAAASRIRQQGDAAALRGVGDLARAGQGLVKLGFDLAARMEDDAATAAADAYMKEKRAEYFGTSDAQGNFFPGRLSRNMDDPGLYVEDARKWDADLAGRHFGGLSKGARAKAERAVAGLDLQTQNAVVRRAGAEYQARRIGAADEAVRLHADNVLSLYDAADQQVRAATWGAWNDAVEASLDAHGVTDPAARREARRRNAEALVSAALARKVQSIKERTNGLAPEQVKEEFGKLKDDLSENGYRAVICGDIKNAQGRPVADWLDADLKTGDSKALKAALSGQLDKARSAAMREAEAREREARQAVGRDFTEQELALRDVAQELWADAYDKMGKDEKLKKAFPERAMAYRDAAAKMREAEKKAQAQASADAIKGNEDRIYWRLIDFIYAKKLGYLSGQAAADEQAAVWRDFRLAVAGKAVGKDFPDRFTARLDKELNEQQVEAMRYTMQLFGYNAETDSRGRVGAAERNKATNNGVTFKTPFKVEGWLGDSQPTISASQLFDILDRLWRLLDGQDKGGNRLETAKEMAEGAKVGWLHDGYNGMIEGMADAFMRNEVDRRSGEEYREAE